MKHIASALLILLFGLGLFIKPIHVSAQEISPTPSDDEVNAVAREIYCPVCENVPLDVCGTQACEQWRSMIRQNLTEGKSAEEIKLIFAAQYGEQVLAQPSKTGINWLIYILPVVFLCLSVLYAISVYLPRKSNIYLLKQSQIDHPEEIDHMEQMLRNYQERSKDKR